VTHFTLSQNKHFCDSLVFPSLAYLLEAAP